MLGLNNIEDVSHVLSLCMRKCNRELVDAKFSVENSYIQHMAANLFFRVPLIMMLNVASFSVTIQTLAKQNTRMHDKYPIAIRLAPADEYKLQYSYQKLHPCISF
ncbi:unnamed protein product [Cunninghamella echinulata]